MVWMQPKKLVFLSIERNNPLVTCFHPLCWVIILSCVHSRVRIETGERELNIVINLVPQSMPKNFVLNVFQ